RQEPRAIARPGIGPGGAAVGEVLQDLQALLDDRVAFPTLDVSDEADAARVVLAGRVVQPLGLGQLAMAHFAPPGAAWFAAASNCSDRRTPDTAARPPACPWGWAVALRASGPTRA